MLDRRGFVLLTGAGLLAACGPEEPPGPAVVNLSVTGGPGMNPGPDGQDRPVTVTVLRLRDVGVFNTADIFALQSDPATVLAADLVGMEQLAVAPGATAATALTLPPEVTHVGLIALLRDPTGRVWRAAIPAAPGATVNADVTLGVGGMALGVA